MMKKVILTSINLLLNFTMLFAIAPVVTAFSPVGGRADQSRGKDVGVKAGTSSAPHEAAVNNIYACNAHAFMQAQVNIGAFLTLPAISYSTLQTFTQGVAISPVSPVNSGDPVSAPAYDNVGTVSLAFTNPYGVAVDASGNVYVADYGSGLVLKFTGGSGSPTTIASGFSSPKGLAVDRAGNIYVADAGNKAIKKIPAGGGTVVTVGLSFNSPIGLAVDAAGNLYVSDNSANAVYQLPAGGGSAVTVASGFGNPQGLAVDGAGNIFVCDVSTGLIKVPAGGQGIKLLTEQDLMSLFVSRSTAPGIYLLPTLARYIKLQPAAPAIRCSQTACSTPLTAWLSIVPTNYM
jgi:sugar lactone lactonase YvrE